MKTLLSLALYLFLAGVPVMAVASDSSIPLVFTKQNIHDAEWRVLEGGVIEIWTTGPDPYVFTEPLTQPVDPRRQYVLGFEYFSTTGTDHMQVFLVPPLDEAHSVKGEGLIHSEGFSSFAMDLKPVLDQTGGSLRALRLDFGSASGKVIRIRGLQLRPPTSQELQLAAGRAARREADEQLDARLRDYLRRPYPCRVTRVTVDDRQVRVEGEVERGRGDMMLAEVPLFADVTRLTECPTLQPIEPDVRGRFSVMIDRHRKKGDHDYDRLLSRWAVVRKTGNSSKLQLLSHARYPDTVQSRWKLPEEVPRNKKGIGALSVGRPVSDLVDLDISAATVNITLNGLLYTTPGQGRTLFHYGGRDWYADDRYVERLDRDLLEGVKHHLVISAIILIGQAKDTPDRAFGRLIAHPDADPSGIFAMPNVSSEEGLEAYAAALDYLAQRYSRPDNLHGRVHHWIMHNEINAGWVWTNAGEKTALVYMDLYHKSMRVAHLIARQYNPHARAFISLEHHWTHPPPRFYAGRDLLDLLVEFSRAEGDFDWAIAFHPYPQDLFEPRVWEDNQVNFTLDTPKITYKNLEVLDAWVRQRRTYYLGKRPRIVHLTEQGLNSRDYSEKALRDQAAGMAYAWNKIKHLDTIQAFDYHNWVDNRGEGGLRIGLRRFPDDPEDPLGRKPIWFVYQALGTNREEEVTDPYKTVIGIRDWSEIRYHGVIR